jgi:hypothetical protein
MIVSKTIHAGNRDGIESDKRRKCSVTPITVNQQIRKQGSRYHQSSISKGRIEEGESLQINENSIEDEDYNNEEEEEPSDDDSYEE